MISRLSQIALLSLCISYASGDDQWGLPVLEGFPTPDDIKHTSEIITKFYGVEKGHAAFVSYHVNMASYLHNLPPMLLTALIKVESDFNPHAVSLSNAYGYTQVMPEYWDNLAPYKIKAPEENIYAGAFVLDQYRMELGELEAAAMAYNIGITNYKANRLLVSGKDYLNKLQKQLVNLNDH